MRDIMKVSKLRRIEIDQEFGEVQRSKKKLMLGFSIIKGECGVKKVRSKEFAINRR